MGPPEVRNVPPLHAVIVVLIFGGFLATPLAQSAPGSFKLAFYNIKSGKGQVALPGAPSTFADTSNCTNRQIPLNAWGMGVVQSVLRTQVAADAEVVALGLAEAWPCATPAAVREVLGWKAHSTERNGVAIVARHGFAGPELWEQLDTSLNANPLDTMWVLRVPVCLDKLCSDSVVVYTAHWYASGLTAGTPPELTSASFDRQARQTVDFLKREPSLTPHVLIGDLNVFAGTQVICEQHPWNAPLQQLSSAGYIDAWAHLHGPGGGFTGMWNRAGCGTPVGNLWKRIDYSWSRHLTPKAMTHFGVVAPGREAPSDHAGILVEYLRSTGAVPTLPSPTPTVPAPADRPPVTTPVVPPRPGPAFGSVDTPLDGSTVAGEVAIGGWGLDDSAVAGVDIYRTPVAGEAAEANGLVWIGGATFVEGARPDVALAYPSYPDATRAGWGYMLLSNLLPDRGNGRFTFHAFARTIDGARTALGSKTITVANQDSRAPFGTIDTPAQGEQVSGTIINFGWALTPGPHNIAVDGSAIDVYIDGIHRGHPVYNNYRADIAQLFPGYANSAGAVGYFILDTTTLSDGVHSIAWVVRDSGGNASGIGSRFFTVANR